MNSFLGVALHPLVECWCIPQQTSRFSLPVSYMGTHPALQGQCVLMTVRGTPARLERASCSEKRCPLRHDSSGALPPPDVDDT